MGEAKRRKQAAIRALAEAVGGDMDLARHMYEKQVRPQELTRELREQGHDVEVALVNTSADAPGYEVTCVGCGRTAKLPFQPPEGKVVLCPDCQRSPR